MKKALVVLTILLSLFAGVAIASANSGSAIIPHYQAYVNEQFRYYTWVYLSNITDQDINVEVILYKRDGTILFDTDNNISGYYLSNYNENLPNATLSFTLGPNSFGKFGISSYDHHDIATTAGYGIIKWEQDSKAVHGLVAQAIGFLVLKSNPVHPQLSIPINNGLPF
ncbi:MAG: hypothetical protein MI740_16130 [Halanaerobiales bacterium]|nr:hypothetical protein [Halanaerobiales bacterium]